MQARFREWVTPATVGVISFGIGIAVGHFWTKYHIKQQHDEVDRVAEKFEEHVTQLQFQFDENADKMNSLVQQANRVVGKFKEDGQDFLNKFADPVPETTIDSSKENHPSQVKQYSLVTEPSDKEDDEVLISVFIDDEDDEWNYDEELEHRSPDRPYIIHRDEYFSNEMDFRQSTLMYYGGDNILTDELDVPIYSPEKVVGKLEFGHGSRDPNIVYIRNEQHMAEYEVLLDHGYYQTEVLGEQVNLKHSRPLNVLKFRDD